MPLQDYLAGAVLFTAMLAAVVLGAVIVVRRRLSHLDALEQAMAGALVGTALLILVNVVPLALGVLTRGSVIIECVVMLAVIASIPAVADGGVTPRDVRAPRPVSSTASWVVAACGAGFALIEAVGDLRAWATTEVVGLDPLTFHLPNVGRWIQTGSLWQIDQFLPRLAHGDYPNNGDVVLLSTVLPWHNDFLARFAIAGFAALTAVAVVAIARELRAPPAASILAGAAVVTIPVIGLSAIPRAMPDSVLYATFALGVLFLARHARTGRRSDLLLGALGMAIALGTKWYGVSAVGATLVVWALARLIARKNFKKVLGESVVVAVITIAGGAIWFARNWVESGNPVFPAKVAPLGITIFDAPPDTLREAVGFSITHYAGNTTVLGDLVKELLQGLGPIYIVAAVGLLVALAAGAWRADRRLVIGAAMAAAVGAVYVATPGTALGLPGHPDLADVNTRYAVPALIIAAPITAWAVARLRGAGIAVEIALALSAVLGATSGFAVHGAGSLVKAALGVALLGAIGLGLWRVAGMSHERPLALGVAIAVLGLVLLGAGERVQRGVNETRYIGADPALDVVLRAAPSGHRIGLAGVWSVEGVPPIWPSFGMRIGNRVEYVGHFVQGFLTAYSTAPSFDAALQRGRYEVLVVGRGLQPPQPVPAERWAIKAGWRTIGLSKRLRVLIPPDARGRKA